MFHFQIVRVQRRWLHLADRSKRVMCWRVRLMVILSRVTRGLTVMEMSCLLVLASILLKLIRTWSVQQPATLPLHVALQSLSVELPSVRIYNTDSTACRLCRCESAALISEEFSQMEFYSTSPSYAEHEQGLFLCLLSYWITNTKIYLAPSTSWPNILIDVFANLWDKQSADVLIL